MKSVTIGVKRLMIMVILLTYDDDNDNVVNDDEDELKIITFDFQQQISALILL